MTLPTGSVDEETKIWSVLLHVITTTFNLSSYFYSPSGISANVTLLYSSYLSPSQSTSPISVALGDVKEFVGKTLITPKV